MVDFHTHILPGIDDGSSSVEESLEMLRMEAQQGITCVVATPHFYARRDNLEVFLERRGKSAAKLYRAMAEHEGLPKLILGAEVRFFQGMSESVEISRLALEGTRYILLEMPPAPWTEAQYRELEVIYKKQGLVPIIAHVDRYLTRYRTFGIFRRLTELPVLVQANADFFLRKTTARQAMKLLQEGSIHVLGSDCHNLEDRKPNLHLVTEKIRKSLGEKTLEQLQMRETLILAFQ